jgi:hypothetical protein
MNLPERELAEIKAEYERRILEAATTLHKDLLACGFKVSRMDQNIANSGVYIGKSIVAETITAVTVSLTLVPVGSDGSISVVI